MAKSKTGPGGWQKGLRKFLFGAGVLLLVLGLMAGVTASRPYVAQQGTGTPAVTDTLTPTVTQTAAEPLTVETAAPTASATSEHPATQENVIQETPQATPTPTPEGWLNNPQLRIAGVAAAACCLGLLLAGVLIGIAVWFRRRSRRTGMRAKVSGGRECPRCGANCQADARFCYRCGLSFVPSAIPLHTATPPPAAPPRPAPAAPPPAPPIACTKCGQALRAASKFCPKCGQPTGR